MINGLSGLPVTLKGGALSLSPSRFIDSTPYTVHGTVKYAACDSDEFNAKPGIMWEAKSRGACLLTRVDATVQTSTGNVKAKSYTSSGTSYSWFAVISRGGNVFEVTRVVN